MLTDLKQQNEVAMTELGLLIPAEQIYNPNSIALKDAVVHFGGGCTGEVISAEGLVLTNHHCGYGAIQQHSSVEHDYLTDGFWAMSRSEELPCKGLTVTYIDEIMDVTDYVNDQLQIDSDPNGTNYLSPKYLAMIADRFLSAQGITLTSGHKAELKAFYGGNKYYLFLKTTYSDIRMVGAPPSSIGKFGADTDNWMWPRHTGDFSIFRVYAGPDNRPADYSPENRPYKAEKFLKISLGGYDEGDFAMIMGFPGSTQRYMTSYEIDRLLEVENPQRIFIRGERQAILKEDMAASAKVRIQYASKYAQSSNYWKNSIGKSRGIRRLDVKGRKQEQEAAFTAWAAKNTLPTEGYSNALNLIRESVEETAPYFASSQYLSEAIGRSVEILAPARLAVSKKGGELTEALKAFYKDYNMPTDRRVAKRMFRIVGENCKELPSVFAEVIGKRFGGDTDAYVDYLYDNSVFADETRALEFVDRFSRERLDEDPAALLALSAYFSATETAFNSMNRTRVRAMAEKGDKDAELALKLSENYDRLLSTILVGNNIVNIALAAIGTMIFVNIYGASGAAISTGVVTVLVLIFGEISPKSLAKDCPEKFALKSAALLRLLTVILCPLNWLFSLWKKLLNRVFRLESDNKMSQEELLMLVDEVQQEGSIDGSEGELLKNAIEFTEREAEDILTHRVDMEAVSKDASKEDIAKVFSETKYSRLPVYDGDIDNIIGVIHQKDFYTGNGIIDRDISHIIAPAVYVLKNEKISSILKLLQRKKAHVAVVLDEYGGTCGMITMEDILEELVGEIWDEHDEITETVQQTGENSFTVDGAMDMDDFVGYFGIKADTDATSAGGWITEQLGHIPEAGDTLEYENLDIKVLSMDNHRIEKFRIDRVCRAEAEAGISE